MSASTFRMTRKQDGFITEPITEAQAKGIAGYPGEWTKLAEVKPIVHREEVAPKAKAKPKPAAKPRSRPAAKPASPAPVPETDAGAGGSDT